MSHTQSLDSIRDILFMVMDNKLLITADKFKKARNDFLKSPSELSAQYRYALAMIYSKDKTHIEEGLKMLKDLYCNANFPDLSNCLYHICYGSFRIGEYQDVKLYAEKLFQESPNLLPDKDSMAVIMHKTQSLVLLSDEFIQKPHLFDLVSSKSRKKGIKSLLHHKSTGKKDTKVHLRCMSDASRPPPQVVLTDVSNVEQPQPTTHENFKGFYRTPTINPAFAVSTGHIGKKHLSVEMNPGPRDMLLPSPSRNDDQYKRRSCPPNFLAASSWESTITSTPSSSLLQPVYPTREELDLSYNPDKENNHAVSECINHSSAGDILDLEEQFSELRGMYESLLRLSDKTNPAPVQYNNENNLKDSSQSGQQMSDDTPIETPSRLLSFSTTPATKKDLLSDSDSTNENQENAMTIERALIDLPPLQLPEPENRPFISRPLQLPETENRPFISRPLQLPETENRPFISRPLQLPETENRPFISRPLQLPLSKSQFSLPSTSSKYSSEKVRAHVTKSVSITSDTVRPWIIIRRFGRRGGKKIRLPSSLHDLLQISGDKLGIVPVCIREVSTEAEIEDITSIDPDSVLWVMTAEDEKHFCNPEEEL